MRKANKITLSDKRKDVMIANLTEQVKDLRTQNERLIQQEDDYGCAIACLAMAAEMSYADMRREVQEYWETFRPLEKYKGLGFDDDAIILYKLGYRMFPIRRPQDMKPLTIKKFIGRARALVTVPSINVPGLYHALFWDGEYMHDPSKLKTYTAAMAWRDAVEFKVVQKAKALSSLYGIKGDKQP